ncbi:MAG: signal transduction histidine kinase [Candidatus Omnitrophota bacterium]|jgi:signal transduction histidine kinase
MKIRALNIRRILPKRIWQQIFFILLFLVVVPLLILGFTLLNSSQNAIKTTVLRDHKEIAVHATGEIKEHIKGAKENLSVAASILGLLHADPWHQETAINELSLMNSAFQRISSINKDGFEVATSELGTELYNREQEEGFQEAILGVSYLSEVKISDNHIPYLTIAEPIKKMGKVESVLIANLSLRSVWGVIDGIKIGKLGTAYLIDRKGRIIAHQDKKFVLNNANFKHIKNFLSAEPESFTEINDKGEPSLISYAPIEGLQWGLVITQPEKEAYAFSRIMNQQFLAIIAISLLATICISFLLAQYMSRPMRGMIEGTERIARGDFSYAFRIRSKNEIDRLLFSFNRMTRKLRRAQEDEKLSMIGKAATVIAHELKNSLQLVTTFVNLLPERSEDKKFLKEFSDTIPRELDGWNTSLKNMMTFAGRNAPRVIEETDVNETVQEIMLLARLRARQANINFIENLQDDLPIIQGNREKLKQVMLNLTTNALEATPWGGDITVTTKYLETTLNDSDQVEITVKNTIEKSNAINVSQVFEPFHTTKVSGLGLGLAICKEIIERYDGNIKAFIDEEKTSVFFVIKVPTKNQVTPNNSTLQAT